MLAHRLDVTSIEIRVPLVWKQFRKAERACSQIRIHSCVRYRQLVIAVQRSYTDKIYDSEIAINVGTFLIPVYLIMDALAPEAYTFH